MEREFETKVFSAIDQSRRKLRKEMALILICAGVFVGILAYNYQLDTNLTTTANNWYLEAQPKNNTYGAHFYMDNKRVLASMFRFPCLPDFGSPSGFRLDRRWSYAYHSNNRTQAIGEFKFADRIPCQLN